MRLWTLHPKYIDNRGLVALWRESLLAQAVLKGKTKGYLSHPQLSRFKSTTNPVKAISYYLNTIYDEAKNRGFNFDNKKFKSIKVIEQITTTDCQLYYEWEHLKQKVKQRDKKHYCLLKKIKQPESNPIFKIVNGQIEEWEIIKEKK